MKSVQESQSKDIDTAIKALEERRMMELAALKGQLKETGQSLKPANIIKSAVSDLTSNNNFKSYIMKAAIGLAIGLLSKRLLKSKAKVQPENFVSRVMEKSLGKLSPTQIKLIEFAAPIIIGIIIKAISKKRLKAEEEMEMNEV
jgi:uncharacterized membrane-anchored protein YhcB (DUF1043 family)